MMTTLESLFAKTHDSRVYTIKKKLHLMYKEILEELIAKEGTTGCVQSSLYSLFLNQYLRGSHVGLGAEECAYIPDDA